MKKLLLLALIALSINAFTQVNPSHFHLKNSVLNGKTDIRVRHNETVSKLPSLSRMINPAQPVMPGLVAGSGASQIIDSVYKWNWDTTVMNWKIVTKTIDIVYDSHNNLLSRKDQNLVGEAWVDTLQSSFTYDSFNNPVSVLVKTWTGSAWENAMQLSQTFDANNNRTNYSWQNWDGSNWVVFMKFIWTYDENNNPVSQVWQGADDVNYSKFQWVYDNKNNKTNEINQMWNDALGNWENTTQSGFTYNGNNKLVEQVDQNWNTDLSTWENSSKTIFEYDTLYNLTTETDQMWNSELSIWEDTGKNIYTYDSNNNNTEKLFRGWDGSEWYDYLRYTYTYDASNNLLNELDENSFESWEKSAQIIYTYDVKNNQTSELDQNWDGNEWQNVSLDYKSFDDNSFETAESHKAWDYSGTDPVISGDSTYLYFHTVVTGLSNYDEAAISVYPNPAKGKITLNTKASISEVEVFSVAGERIKSLIGLKPQSATEIDLTGYAKGIYILKIHDGTKIFNRKVIVQ